MPWLAMSNFRVLKYVTLSYHFRKLKSRDILNFFRKSGRMGQGKESRLALSAPLAWIAKASHFEERLSPAGERCRNSDRVGNVALR